MRSSKRGFTLIEMMVSLAIMAVGGAIAIPQFERMSRRHRLDFLAREIVSNLQLARNMAIIGRPADPANPSAGRIRYVTVVFDDPPTAGSCNLFAWSAGDPRYSLLGSVGPDLFKAPILLKKVEIDLAARRAEDLRVRFRHFGCPAFRADGTSSLYDGKKGTSGSFAVQVIDSDLREQRTITVNGVGYITIKSGDEFDLGGMGS